MDGEVAGLLDEFRGRMRNIAEAQQKRVKLTATATTRDRAISVTVNANGVIIETKFSERVDELSYDQIAKTVTQLAQQAAAEVAAKTKELAAPLFADRDRQPKLSDVIEGMPDIEAEIPLEPPVSLAPPGSSERADEEPAMVFTDVEDYAHGDRRDAGGSVTSLSW
ncbi:YbaB/EbfC family nucleoid-associated protein [Nocardia sp. NPDC127579]|uniref:YbaB/EbfC family nucleoid-associated protein n=1 Tax=Nocardia sp. NPDC127579 TaxID=3345402 RepID=UPI0036436428